MNRLLLLSGILLASGYADYPEFFSESLMVRACDQQFDLLAFSFTFQVRSMLCSPQQTCQWPGDEPSWCQHFIIEQVIFNFETRSFSARHSRSAHQREFIEPVVQRVCCR